MSKTEEAAIEYFKLKNGLEVDPGSQKDFNTIRLMVDFHNARMNDIWHDVSDKPQEDCKVFFILENENVVKGQIIIGELQYKEKDYLKALKYLDIKDLKPQ